MKKLNIITPVKDSIELSLKTIESVSTSILNVPFSYTVYNDFSTPENTLLLQQAAMKYGFELVNLEDITNTPSPNYLMVLNIAQKKALATDAHLVIVESDVVIENNTLQMLVDVAEKNKSIGIVASITTDENGLINYPYLFAKKLKGKISDTKKHLSFCCTLLSNKFLSSYSFSNLDPNKNWYDVHISKQSRKNGFSNILHGVALVIHRPHSSRPWKLLKYTNPIKYYWLKITRKKDRI